MCICAELPLLTFIMNIYMDIVQTGMYCHVFYAHISKKYSLSFSLNLYLDAY